MASASVIKEGFICAECHADFGSVDELLNHYQNLHSQPDSSIKGFLGKAKSKLVNKQNTEELKTPPKYYDLLETDVPAGQSRSQFEYFKRVRSTQVERFSSEANKLLIRLHKLLACQVDDNNKRRGESMSAHEQEIVQWMEEKLVSRCPDCAQSFNLLLRKHHCRLCGSILCEHCSTFIDMELGRSLTSQIGSRPSLNNSSEPEPEPVVPQKNGNDYKIRSCSYCFNLVNKKYLSVYSKPIITQFYERLKSLRDQCEGMSLEYNSIVSSLNQGETLYSKDQCVTLRNNMIKLTEKIDILSKKIILLGTESNETISESEKKLRSRIRVDTINWIREFITGIKSISEKGKPQQSTGEGWTPSFAIDTPSDSDDVIQIQISNTRRWIVEARRAKKQDEVDMLEASLKQLLKFKVLTSFMFSSTNVSPPGPSTNHKKIDLFHFRDKFTSREMEGLTQEMSSNSFSSSSRSNN